MMQEAPKADVIVTNPTALRGGAALRRRRADARPAARWPRAPDLIAARHPRASVREHSRAGVRGASRWRAPCYFGAELGQEIPGRAVPGGGPGGWPTSCSCARRAARARPSTPPGDLPIPPELRRDA
ncbi:MAG: hypothetical protein MZV65_54545 [Chromatiales bacterium]|nr:hypothetical protein [Chromatiales bacterium]